MTVILIALGGALGSVARYLIASATGRLLGAESAAYGTMAVNIIGSFLMGLAFVMVMERAGMGTGARAPLLMTGFLGGFTTFSAFSLDALRLFEGGRMGEALAYVIASVVVSIAALVAGVVLARTVMA